jgi:hypothetical protein
VTAATNDVRVDLDVPAGYLPGPHGLDAGTTVQFVDITSPAAGVITVGLVRLGNYSPAAPDLLNALQPSAVDGNKQLLSQSNQPTLVSSDYSHRGFTSPTTEAMADDTGAVWGVAQLDARYAFTSAFFKRHSRSGPGGLGTIYLTDLTLGPNASPWTTIPNVGANPRVTPPEQLTTADDWFHDFEAVPFVGKIAFGGIATAPDRMSLYVVSLNSKSLWKVPLILDAGGAPIPPDPASLVEIAMPIGLPGAAVGCSSPDHLRPFGVSAQNGSLWITLTCTGPGVPDLHGYVYRYDPTAGTFDAAPAFEMALSGYPRGVSASPLPAAWNAWDDVTWPGVFNPASKPQPLLSDVAFDSNGDMTIGIKDRFGDQAGHIAGDLTPGSNTPYAGLVAGDILRACRNPADTAWDLESNGSCGSRTGAAPGNNQGPGGGEFYADSWPPCCHDQVSLGALLQLPGYGQVLNTSFDPGPTFASANTEGYRFYSNLNGAANDFHRIRVSGGPGGGGFGKSGGLGDMAALIGAAPLEIGNRVWIDSDGDGCRTPASHHCLVSP